MPDTMTMTKIVGGFCGALLIFLLANWAGELIYDSEGGHGDEQVAGYVIETGSDEEAGSGAEEGPDLATLMESADAEKGAKVYGKCKACHKLEDGENATGPTLYAVVGREVGSVPGYDYSGALKAVAEVWGHEELDAFLENPKGYAPGTKMSFSGLKKAEDRADLIAYLETIGG